MKAAIKREQSQTCLSFVERKQARCKTSKLEGLDEGLGDLEGVFRYMVPEIMVLRGIGIAKGNVADDAERDERNLVEITGLGNGARLHIDSLGIRELLNDTAHLLLCIDEPVASNH